MKHAAIIIALLAFTGVAVLGVMVFTIGNNTSDNRVVTHKGSTISTGTGTGDIAYFELDTLENQYKYSIEMRSYLRKKDDEYNKRLAALRNNFSRELQEANQRGQMMSQSEQMQVQQKLANLENEFKKEQAEGGRRLESETIQKVQEVKRRIQQFLKEYAVAKGYKIVLASSENDFIYYKDSSQNITRELVEALNKEYAESKKNK